MNPLTQFKKRPILPLLIALALVALVSPRVARADAVTDWNAIASTAIVDELRGSRRQCRCCTLRWCRGRYMTRSMRSTVAIGRTLCSRKRIRRTQRRRPRRRRRSACSWA